MRFWLKRFLFLFLRVRNEVAFLEGPQGSTGDYLRACYVGGAARREYFVSQIFGYLPQERIAGRCISTQNPRRFARCNGMSDIVMIEINRLFMDHYVRSGFFPVPEWVEFERPVVREAIHRYAGAARSLRSDLNRIHKSPYRMKISRDPRDFDAFYKSMYLPYVRERHGSGCIIKPKHRLKRAFSSGVLVLLLDGEAPVAGAIVVVDRDAVKETAIGVRDGSEGVLRTGVSGILDYYIHEWAAVKGKHYMNVGHTRPFPCDGVYFNKRKWMMAIIPDGDGVTNVAFRFNVCNGKAARLLRAFPLVFQTSEGLHLLCSVDQQQPVTVEQVRSLHRQFWTEGLQRLIVLAPAGFQADSLEYARKEFRSKVFLTTNLESSNQT